MKYRNTITLSSKKFESLKETKEFQINGFTKCLHVFLITQSIYCKSNQIYEHLFSQMKHLSVDQMPKVFKLSLATFFSREMKQELPEDSQKAVELFPKLIYKLIRKSYNNEFRKVKILWNLLQSKSIANEVPNSMIKSAYEKHAKVLSTVGSTPQPILNHLGLYAREFALEVQKIYNDKTYLAPNKGYLGWPRSKGGCRKALEPLLKFTGGRRIVNTLTRIDPVVIHLYGKPGKGKSFLTAIIANRISKIFGYNYVNCYQRSIGTDHWDGYRNQLIAQIDDLFTKRDFTDDAAQIIQMCSNIDYVLPMADLREKGKKFDSRFLILSSNHPTTLDHNCINNREALFRRIFPAYEILDYDRKSQLYRISLSNFSFENKISSEKILYLKQNEIVNLIVEKALFDYDEHLKSIEKIDERCYSSHFQPIVPSKIGEYGYGYVFPNVVSEEIPKVKAHAIPEPLKIRMITKGETGNWILKPLQKAMFEAMKQFQCFKLTSGQDIDLSNLNLKNTYLLSGDYESATDNLHMDAMETIVRELVKVLPRGVVGHLIRESGPHEIAYPKNSGISAFIQRRGQLMGSLLSFPILCVINAATIGLATRTDSLYKVPAQINGDDILFCENTRTIKSWKNIARLIGLKPSIGKNFQSRFWGSINSQLITRNGLSWKVEPTGLFNCLIRKPDAPLTITKALSVFDKALIVSISKEQLRKTPQSIDISWRYGGLGLRNTKTPNDEDMMIYLFRILAKKVKIELRLDDKILVSGPKSVLAPFVEVDLVRDAAIQGQYPPTKVTFGTTLNLYDEDQNTDSDNQIFDWNGYKAFKKFAKTVPALREKIRKREFDEPINHHKNVTIWLNREFESLLSRHVMIT